MPMGKGYMQNKRKKAFKGALIKASMAARGIDKKSDEIVEVKRTVIRKKKKMMKPKSAFGRIF